MTSTQPEPVHSESEDHKRDINVPDHPTRPDSPEYVAGSGSSSTSSSSSAEKVA
jgi:hypothetical protein